MEKFIQCSFKNRTGISSAYADGLQEDIAKVQKSKYMIRISTLRMLFDSTILNSCKKLGQSLLISILTFTFEGSLTLDEKGLLHLPPLEKAVPEDVERLKKLVYKLLPHLL